MQVREQQLGLDMEQQTGSKSVKEYIKTVYCHPVYLTYMQSKYIMRNTGLDEAQAGIKVAGRNINNLRYADDATFMAESEEELKSLLMKVKERSEISRSVVSDSLRPHESQHTRPPCPSPIPIVHPNSCPSSW